MTKSTNAEIDKRILEIYTLLCKGYTYSDIVRYCKDTLNVTSERTVWKYINSATEKIKNNISKDMEVLRSEANTRYMRWLRKCEEKGKYKDAAFMQSRMDKINGLEVTKVEHSGEVKSDLSQFINPILELLKN